MAGISPSSGDTDYMVEERVLATKRIDELIRPHRWASQEHRERNSWTFRHANVCGFVFE